MKAGRNLADLATEIARQHQAKKDFVVRTDYMEMFRRDLAAKPDVGLGFGDQTLGVKYLGHRQLADHVRVPQVYYDRLRAEAPDLLCTNVNHWFKAEPTPRMVRTLDGEVRAFLSDRYRPLENYDLAEAALPILGDLNVQILSCEITEKRLYIKAVDTRIQRDCPSGRKMGDGSHLFFDTLSPAIIISNSEVGCGSMSIETGVWTRVCTNMAISGQRSMRKYHVGAKHELGEAMFALLSEQTRRLTDAAVFSQVRDVVKGAFEVAKFDALVQDMALMSARKIEGDPIKVIDLTAKYFGINDGEKPSILKHLIEGGDLTQYGLFNAITRTAEDLPDYDRATEFERLGGQMIELPTNDWKRLALAA